RALIGRGGRRGEAHLAESPPTPGGRRERRDRRQEGLCIPGTGCRLPKLVGTDLSGCADWKVGVSVVEADTNEEAALSSVGVEIAGRIALTAHLDATRPTLRIVRILDHPLGGAVRGLLPAAGDAVRERRGLRALSGTGIARCHLVTRRVRATGDGCPAAHTGRAGISRRAGIAVVARRAVRRGRVRALPRVVATVDTARVAVVAGGGRARGGGGQGKERWRRQVRRRGVGRVQGVHGER